MEPPIVRARAGSARSGRSLPPTPIDKLKRSASVGGPAIRDAAATAVAAAAAASSVASRSSDRSAHPALFLASESFDLSEGPPGTPGRGESPLLSPVGSPMLAQVSPALEIRRSKLSMVQSSESPTPKSSDEFQSGNFLEHRGVSSVAGPEGGTVRGSNADVITAAATVPPGASTAPSPLLAHLGQSLSATEAEQLLTGQHKGTFIIRKPPNNPPPVSGNGAAVVQTAADAVAAWELSCAGSKSQLYLSVVTETGRIGHSAINIFHSSSGETAYAFCGESEIFRTVEALVLHHQAMPVTVMLNSTGLNWSGDWSAAVSDAGGAEDTITENETQCVLTTPLPSIRKSAPLSWESVWSAAKIKLEMTHEDDEIAGTENEQFHPEQSKRRKSLVDEVLDSTASSKTGGLSYALHNNIHHGVALKRHADTMQQHTSDLIRALNAQKARGKLATIRRIVTPSHPCSSAMIAVYFLFIYLTTGLLFYSYYMNWPFVKALYFVVVTVTTVGYGDHTDDADEIKIHEDTGAMLFTSFFVLIGVGLIIASVALIVRQYQAKVRRVHSQMEEQTVKHMFGMDDETIDSELQEVFEAEEEELARKPCVIRGVSAGWQWLMAHPLARAVLWTIIVISAGIIFGTHAALDCGSANDCARWDFTQAFYWAVVTGTTVGYGDYSPAAHGSDGMWFGVFYVFLSVLIVGNLLNMISQLVISVAIYHDHIEEPDEVADKVATQLDLNHDGEITKDEWLRAMLISLDKVDGNLCDVILGYFDKIDVDGDGVLTKEELEQSLMHDPVDPVARERKLTETSRRESVGFLMRDRAFTNLSNSDYGAGFGIGGKFGRMAQITKPTRSPSTTSNFASSGASDDRLSHRRSVSRRSLSTAGGSRNPDANPNIHI